MKKKFCPSYTYPTLKNGYRTYIEFNAMSYLEDKNGVYTRFRKTFNLNRIHNLPDRKERGEDLCAKIKHWLKAGHCIDDFEEHKVFTQIRQEATKVVENTKLSTNAFEALDIALQLKHSDVKTSSNRTNLSHIRRFKEFLKNKKYHNFAINDISKVIAFEYLDYYKLERKVRNNTLNNIIIHLRALLNPIKDRGYMLDNPFAGIKPYKSEEKIRRNFQEDEARLMMKYVYKNDRVLFYSIILQYACLIRPSEIRRLRFHDFDLEQMIVILERKKTKMETERIATIPEEFQRFFKEEFWTKYNQEYYIFGEKCKPHPHIQVGKNALYRRHEKVLKHFQNNGQLENIKGLHYYSWKDTGITDIIDEIGLMTAFDQAGHKDIKQTMKYRHRKRINTKIRPMTFSKIKNL